MSCGENFVKMSEDSSDDEYCVYIGMTVIGGCEVEDCPGPFDCPYTTKFRDEDEYEDDEEEDEEKY